MKKMSIFDYGDTYEVYIDMKSVLITKDYSRVKEIELAFKRLYRNKNAEVHVFNKDSDFVSWKSYVPMTVYCTRILVGLAIIVGTIILL